MLYQTRTKTRRIVGIVAMAFVTFLSCSCSRGARVARMLEQANRYFEAGELEKAEIEYKNALQKDPRNAHALGRLGLLYHAQGRDVRAAAFLSKARDLQPDNLDLRVKLALAELGSGAPKAARDDAAFVLERRPADDQAPLILVEGSTTPVEFEDARQRLQALPSAAARSAPVIVALGNLAMRQNRPKDAEVAFKEAVAADPKCAAAHGALGTWLFTQKDIAGADAAFKQAAELSPMRSGRRIHYARFKAQIGDANAAKTILEEITRKAPDYFAAWLWLAELALDEKKIAEADAYLTHALAQEPQHPEAVLINARLRLAKGENDKAIADLERLQTAFPKSTPIAYQLGLAYVAAGETNKAITRLAQVTAAAPEMVQAPLALAEIHLRKRDFAAAAAVLKPLAQQHPEIPAARLMLAEAYRGQGELNEAAQLYTEIEKQRPSDARVAFARGTVLLQQSKPAEARAQFEKALLLKPDLIAALEQLVNLDLREKAPAKARQRVEAALASSPESPQLTLLLGTVCTTAGDLAAAENAFKKTIELQPNRTEAHYYLAQLYVGSKQRDKAIANLRDSTHQNPQYLGAHLLLGVLLETEKDYAGARDEYEKAIAIDPKSSLALNNLACLYTEQFAQPDKALDLARRVRALMPNDPRTADTFGWALAKKKQYAQALIPLQESAAKLPDEAEVHYHLGVVHYMLGDEAAARIALQRAVDRNVNLAWTNDARERLAFLQIDPARITTDARSTLEKRLAERPDDPIALLRAGELERRHGDPEKALAHFTAILKDNPKHAVALIDVARIYAAKRNLAKAIESAKAARNAAPGDIDITHTVGRIAYDAGDHRWAASLLQDVAKARPEDSEALFDFAQACYSVGRVADTETNLRRALELKGFTRGAAADRFLEMMALAASPMEAASHSAKIEQALRAEPALLPALMAQAVAAEQQPDTSAARKDYEKLLSQFPDFAPAQRNVTILYAASSADAANGSAIATKARQAFPNDVTLARAIGIIAYREGEFAKAANFLLEAANKNKNDGEALYYLGMAQNRLNKRSESKETLQRALDAGLQEAHAAEAKKTIASAD